MGHDAASVCMTAPHEPQRWNFPMIRALWSCGRRLQQRHHPGLLPVNRRTAKPCRPAGRSIRRTRQASS